MRLSEPIESPGEFWLPSSPEYKVSGLFKVNTEGRVTVDLFGIIDDAEDERDDILVPARFPLLGAKNIGRVVGVLEQQVVTLDDCIQSGLVYSFNGAISRSTLDAKFAYATASHYFEDGEATLFSSVDVSYTGLQEWLSLAYWTSTTDYTDSKLSHTVSSAPPNPIEVKLRDGTALSFEVSGFPPGVDPASTEITLRQTARLRITTPSLDSLSTYTDLARRFQNFLSLAVNRPLPIASLVGFSPSVARTVEEEVKLPINIYGRYSNPPESNREIRRSDLLFEYKDVRDSLEAKLNLWRDMYEAAGPALNLYFAVTQDVYGNVEGELLALAQAAEGFHRHLVDSEPNMPPEEFERLVKEIQEALSAEAWKLVKRDLNRANDPVFRRRIKELIQPVERHMGNSKERGSFIEKVVSTRNLLTHQSKGGTDDQMSARSLIKVTQKLRALLQMQLLHQLGFSDTEIDSMVEKHIKHRLDVELL